MRIFLDVVSWLLRPVAPAFVFSVDQYNSSSYVAREYAEQVERSKGTLDCCRMYSQMYSRCDIDTNFVLMVPLPVSLLDNAMLCHCIIADMYVQMCMCSVDNVKGAKDLVGNALVVQELPGKKTETCHHGDSAGVEFECIGLALPFLALVVWKVNPGKRLVSRGEH